MQPAVRNRSLSESSSSMEPCPVRKSKPAPIKVIEVTHKAGNPCLIPEYIKVNLPDTKVENTAIMLLGKTETTCKTYSETKSKKREKIYTKENKSLVKSTTKKTALTVIKKDAKKNSQVMAASVMTGCAVGSVGWAGGPLGGIIGMSIGGGIGFFVGGIYIKNNVTKKINLQIFTSEHYIKWRANAVIQKVFPIFKNFLDLDKQFEDFFCPISQDLIISPMRAPDGRTYEKEMIEIYLDVASKNNPEKKCESPIRGKGFSKSELVFDLSYCQKLLLKTNEVYKMVKQIGADNVLKNGLKAVQKNTKETITALHDSVRMHYFNLYSSDAKNKQMTIEELNMLVKKECVQWDWNF